MSRTADPLRVRLLFSYWCWSAHFQLGCSFWTKSLGCPRPKHEQAGKHTDEQSPAARDTNLCRRTKLSAYNRTLKHRNRRRAYPGETSELSAVHPPLYALAHRQYVPRRYIEIPKSSARLEPPVNRQQPLSSTRLHRSQSLPNAQRSLLVPVSRATGRVLDQRHNGYEASPNLGRGQLTHVRLFTPLQSGNPQQGAHRLSSAGGHSHRKTREKGNPVPRQRTDRLA